MAVEDAATSGDFNALVLAAGNLIQNAIKYSGTGSSIDVSCELDDAQARLAVLDSGPGIPEAEMSRLTQPFQRGAQPQGLSGAGLGLALVQTVLEAHGGRLELVNRPGGGLSASLLLPRRTLA